MLICGLCDVPPLSGHPMQATSSVCPPAGCHSALGSRPKLVAAPLATPLLPRTAELVSRGFVQSLEAASTNAQRSDLVRAVLVRRGKQMPNQAALGPLSEDPLAIAALPSLSPALAPLLLLQPLHPTTTHLPPPLPAPCLSPQACGFYPHMGRLLPLPPNDRKARTSVLTRKGEKVRVHPASVNAK